MKPVLQALLIADKVYEDKATGKKIIAGTFNRVLLASKVEASVREDEAGNKIAKIPGGMQLGSPSAYFSVTDCYDDCQFELRYVDLSDNKVLLNARVGVRCKDPLATVEVTVPMPPLPTPHLGVYTLELLCKNELLGSLRIVVDELKRGEQQ